VIKEFYDYLSDLPNPAGEIKFLHSTWGNRRSRSFRLFRVPSASVVQEIITLTGEREKALDKRNSLMLELAYGSGLRRMELIRLNVEDVDLVERTAHVWGKGNKDRIVPITGAAVNALREYLFLSPIPRGPLLRSHSGRRLTPEEITWIFKRKIGIRPHLFRHACAVHMLQNGCNIRYIQKLLGHERLDSTQIYTQIDKKNLGEIINKTHPRNLVLQ
jgi:site-specific recombinase XerD